VLIPLGTDRPLKRSTLVVYALIVVNIAAYLVQVLAGQSDGNGIEPLFMLDPQHMSRAWTFITYAFMHDRADFLHLLFNMVFLWAFGPNVEDRFGRLGFLAFYLAAAAASGLAHSLISSHPVIGASGAIAGVTGAYLVLFPRTTIRVLFFFFFFSVRAPILIGIQIFFDVFFLGMGASGNVATGAHLGGYAFGFGLGWLLLATRILPREVYDLFSISKQAKRRREFREAAYQSKRRAQRKDEGKDPGPMGVDQATAERIAQARSKVVAALSMSDTDAAQAYRALLSDYGSTPGACVLNQTQQYDLANRLFRIEDYQTAATAYAHLLDAYPKHRDAGQIRLMLGRIHARYLNDPIKARDLLGEAIEHLKDQALLEMAKSELESLG
jgi:membrane associated rhomboid family serine protease